MSVHVDTCLSHDSVDHGKIQSCKKYRKKGLQLQRSWRAPCRGKNPIFAAQRIPLRLSKKVKRASQAGVRFAASDSDLVLVEADGVVPFRHGKDFFSVTQIQV